MKADKKFRAALVVLAAAGLGARAHAGPTDAVEKASVAPIEAPVAPIAGAPNLTFLQSFILGGSYIPMSGEFLPGARARIAPSGASAAPVAAAAKSPTLLQSLVRGGRYIPLSGEYVPVASGSGPAAAAQEDVRSAQPVPAEASPAGVGSAVVARLKDFLNMAARGSGSIPFDGSYRGGSKGS